MRIVFMGTSEFAVPALKRLHYSLHEIIAVITQPDRPKGRRRKLSKSPIKEAATSLGYKVLQPNKVNERGFIDKIKSLSPDLFVVISFGQILCKHLLEIPKKGAVNVHPSLIPKYRGAAPIQWAIINGDKKTGVTTMLMDRGMDTGCVLLSKSTNIGLCETSSSLHDRLSEIGSELLVETLEQIQDASIILKPQDCEHATTAPILKKRDGEINWNTPAKKIESFIRGMDPWPGAFTFHNDKRLKIGRANVIELNCVEVPGTILKSCSNTLYVATGKYILSIRTIQGAAGKNMTINAFLCGHSFPHGSILGLLKNK